MLHCNDPKWRFVPAGHVDIANFLFIFSASAAEPGALNPWMNLERKDAVVTLFVKDLKADTVSRVIDKTKNYMGANDLPEGIEAKLAGGLLGLTAATNEEIKRSNFLAGVLIIIIVFLLILLSYRSITAGVLMLCNLGFAMLIVFAYMALTRIGLDVSTLPVICLGIGVGVDYSVYIFDRIRSEYKGDLDAAITKALSTSGKCVSFTATTSIVGIIFWKFFSPLRFQADMSLLITILMLLCMLTATILLPSIIRITKPKIVTRQR
jgi:predicted RND superfamily exporter protein